MVAVNLEALILARVAGHQTDVVKHGAGIKKFTVKLEATLDAGERSEVIDAARMTEEQFGLGVSNILGNRARELRVWDQRAFNDL
jgi:hypothetical protein